MQIPRLTLAALAALTLAATTAVAQTRAPDPAVAAGGALFRERCAECHGPDAKGVAGHDLTRLWAAGATDERVFQTIRQGVPNTIMPSSTAPDSELRTLVSYLRSLNGVGVADAAGGNAENGERIFWAQCGRCHTVHGRGGPLGPDLSRIAQSQTREQLTRALRDPNASIPDGYKPITIVTREGQRVRGVAKSEDAFSVQMMDENGRLRGYLKSSIRDVLHDSSSLMPAFGPERLSDSDLADVLTFLATLRGTP
jgi:putative heme-binding domain-containing protein